MNEYNIVYTLTGIALILVWAVYYAVVMAKLITLAVARKTTVTGATSARVLLWVLLLAAAGFLAAGVLA